MSRALRAALAAVTFLTIVPVGRRTELDADDVGRGGPLFPLVGAGTGAVTGVVAWELAKHVDPVVAAAVAVGVGAVVTGALHLDALADTADGLGGRTREDSLRIMRDHHLGAYGVVALVLDLLIKTAAIASLVTHHSTVGALIAAGALSRAVPVPLALAFPYAQPTAGSGGAIGQRATAGGAVVAILLGIVIAGLAVHGNAAPALLAVIGSVLVAAWFARRLGGVTGDVLGAACETCETAVLVVLAAVV